MRTPLLRSMVVLLALVACDGGGNAVGTGVSDTPSQADSQVDWKGDDRQGIRAGRDPAAASRQKKSEQGRDASVAPPSSSSAPEPAATIRQQENLRSGGSSVGGGNATPPSVIPR